MQRDSLADARAFIASVRWTFARTRAAFNPHEYVTPRDAGEPEFSRFVELIRSSPIRRWRGGRYHCLSVDDGFDYWVTRAGGAAGFWIVNRKPSERAGWDESPPPTRDPAELVLHDYEHGLIDDERRDALLRDLEERD
jgi:hypothetical protein